MLCRRVRFRHPPSKSKASHHAPISVCTKFAPTNSCPGANITAGINSVLLHGDVDVMNFSISGGTAPWTDNDRRFLDLVNAGIVVSASAGNTSASVPNPVGQVNHRGPWVMTVAASTKDSAGAGDILANFSLRGPISGTLQNLTKAGRHWTGSNYLCCRYRELRQPQRHVDVQPRTWRAVQRCCEQFTRPGFPRR